MSSVQATSKLRVVIDANVIVSGLIVARSVPGRVLESWSTRLFEVVTSDELVQEVTGALARATRRHGFGESDIRLILDRLAQIEGRAMPLADLHVHCRDPKDGAVLACAFGTNAGYIVTGDKDLLVLDGDPACGSLRIVTPAAFLELLGVE